MIQELLQVDDLRTYFYTHRGTVRAVDGVSISVGEGQSVALVGESGCGKSVTALSVMRLVPPPGKTVGGRVLFKGHDLLGLTPDEMTEVRGAQIATIFQDPMTFLNPVWKVGDQIAEAILLHQDKPKKAARKDAVELIRAVGIPSAEQIIDYYPFQLSGGMRQRILIAMAISCNPVLLIADEPTTALDVTVQMQILHLIKRLVAEKGISLLLITHDLGIVADTCDRVFVMYAGKIVESADISDIYYNPKHPYTKGLLEGVLSIDEFKAELKTIGGFVPDLVDPPNGCRFQPRCPYAKPVCSQEEPPFKQVELQQFTACWLY
jgi:peptide/nickel transport system ATP-binding protein/oligopeptide transport system ATP-binding protein